MVDVHHRFATVDGQEVFYREAGPAEAPVVVLLHGYPTSSHMFRGLIPELADRYHVIAPDYLGFGQSAMPPLGEFGYSFDALTNITQDLLRELGLERYALYVQDYGAPIGWRLASREPDQVTAIITQNGNAYTEGLVDEFWAPVLAYGNDPGPDTEPLVRDALTLEGVRWQYLNGVPDQTRVSPDTWLHDISLLRRPGNAEIQLALFQDYASNIALYPEFHAYFRDTQVPLLAAWGANDGIFAPEGARAFTRDLPEAEVHLLDTGHFALETDLDTIAGYCRGFLGRVLNQ
jgi:pimeloyl-ACP methyl ester carboxylesterase